MKSVVPCSVDERNFISMKPMHDFIQIGIEFPGIPQWLGMVHKKKEPQSDDAGLFVHLDAVAIRDLIDLLEPHAARKPVDPNEPKILYQGEAVSSLDPISELCGTTGSGFDCPAGCCSFGEIKSLAGRPVIKRPECCRLEAEQEIAERAARDYVTHVERCAPDDGDPCCGAIEAEAVKVEPARTAMAKELLEHLPGNLSLRAAYLHLVKGMDLGRAILRANNEGISTQSAVYILTDAPSVSRAEPAEEETVLTEAERIINGPRAQYYGPAYDNHERIADLWSVYINHRFKVKVALLPHDAGLLMDLMKTARLIESPDHRDSFVDKSGYTSLSYGMAVEHKRRTLQEKLGL